MGPGSHVLPGAVRATLCCPMPTALMLWVRWSVTRVWEERSLQGLLYEQPQGRGACNIGAIGQGLRAQGVCAGVKGGKQAASKGWRCNNAHLATVMTNHRYARAGRTAAWVAGQRERALECAGTAALGFAWATKSAVCRTPAYRRSSELEGASSAHRAEQRRRCMHACMHGGS